MEDHRGRSSRSPSVGFHPGSNSSHPSSPHSFHQHSPTLETGNGTFNPAMFGGGMQSDPNEQFNFPDQNNFLVPSPSAQNFQPGNEFQASAQAFERNSISGQARPSQLNLQNSNHQPFTPSFNNPFPSQEDPTFILDPALQSSPQPNHSINPAEIMGDQEQGGAGQNMMQMDARPSSSKDAGFYSSAHSRHVSSLDPSSAGLTQTTQGGEWTGMAGGPFGHRRAPSEHSDISSVGPSPYLKQEGFESFEPSHSPMLNPQQDPSAYQSTLGMERFTINDSTQQGLSPRISPYPSPRMSPHQSVGLAADSHFILPSNDQGYGGSPGPDQNSEMGQVPQIEPPSINVTFAPTRQLDQLRSENNADALSPPGRGRWKYSSVCTLLIN